MIGLSSGSAEASAAVPVLLGCTRIGPTLMRCPGMRERPSSNHQTQPIPNPAEWFAYRLPKRVHQLEVLGNHVVQRGVPIFLFAPQPATSRRAANS